MRSSFAESCLGSLKYFWIINCAVHNVIGRVIVHEAKQYITDMAPQLLIRAVAVGGSMTSPVHLATMTIVITVLLSSGKLDTLHETTAPLMVAIERPRSIVKPHKAADEIPAKVISPTPAVAANIMSISRRTNDERKFAIHIPKTQALATWCHLSQWQL